MPVGSDDASQSHSIKSVWSPVGPVGLIMLIVMMLMLMVMMLVMLMMLEKRSPSRLDNADYGDADAETICGRDRYIYV